VTAPKPAHDQFIYFGKAYPCAQQTDTQTILRTGMDGVYQGLGPVSPGKSEMFSEINNGYAFDT